MKRAIKHWVSLLLFIAVATSLEVASESGKPGKPLSSFGVAPEAVQRVEILYLPERILTRAALTPEMLERQYQYKIEIRDLRDYAQHGELVALLRKTSLFRSGGTYDVRTAVLLYDSGGRRIGALFFARYGKQGVINSESGAIDSGVYRWAKSMMKGISD